MRRTKIQLDDWQYEKLRTLSKREKRTLSSLIRDAVTSFLAPHQPSESRIAESAGIGHDPGAGGRDHDDVLYGPERS